MNFFKKISLRPRSYILLFTFLAFSFATLNFSFLLIERYNKQIADNEYEKELAASGEQRISFAIYEFGAPTHHLESKFINFALFLLSFLLLIKTSYWRVLSSLFLQSLSVFHFGSWLLKSYARYDFTLREFSMTNLVNEYPQGHFSFPFRYLQYSNYLDFIVLVFVVILIFWQVSVLYCFVSERFQAKISLE